jgi:hypothetical protein
MNARFHFMITPFNDFNLYQNLQNVNEHGHVKIKSSNNDKTTEKIYSIFCRINKQGKMEYGSRSVASNKIIRFFQILSRGLTDCVYLKYTKWEKIISSESKLNEKNPQYQARELTGGSKLTDLNISTTVLKLETL